MLEVIGTFTVTETETRTDRSYPTASWYQDVEIEPQTVEVFGEIDDNGEVEDTSIGFALEGTITASFFPSSFGGMSYGNGNRPEDIGKTRKIHARPYAHALAWQFLRDSAPKGLSLEGFEAVRQPFTGYDGTRRETAGIVRTGSRAWKLALGIEELELGVRAYNLLKRMGVDTIGQLANVTAQDLNAWTAANEIAPGYPAARQIADAQSYIAGEINWQEYFSHTA